MKSKKIIALAASLCILLAISANASSANFSNLTMKYQWHAKRLGSNTIQAGYTPIQIEKAYGINQLTQTGSGQTIAIIEAYGNPNIQYDLNVFDMQFKLPQPKITIAYQNGRMGYDSGWALETSLDVEWAHAIAPGAKILLVVAKSDSMPDLLSAVKYANNAGAQVVSMSWDGSEFSSETLYDSLFNNNGTVYVAASGDSGAGAEWPAASPNVLAVGGTTLNLDSSGNRTSAETGWSSSGGGPSASEAEPAWQKSIGITNAQTTKSIPDVAFDADPNTGVAVFDSSYYGKNSGWFELGGTSLGAPVWAALIALADQVKPVTSADALLYQLAGATAYSNPQVNFNDITSGSNGTYSASTGYDYVTGLGTPIANKLVPLM
jgi:subtilase family serine protease